MGRKKVLPRELALAYFDTYYSQLYGKRCWAEMRYALLFHKKKYGALINNYADYQETIAELVCDQQAYDMFTMTGNPLEVGAFFRI